MSQALLRTELAGLPCVRGKVRDVYDLGDGRLLFIATDRISAFDWIMPEGIPDKGRVLTAISAFWFGKLGSELGCPNHLISTRIEDAGLPLDAATEDDLRGRSMIVQKTRIVPFECVVRGYLSGSGWKDYRATGAVCGIELPGGLRESARLDPPIFTPATKAQTGHDENVPYTRMAEALGDSLASRLRELALDLYGRARVYAESRGLILADTKFEFGTDPADPARVILADEILTPDSSRYWPADLYEPGRPQPSFDKQYLRDWLETTDWDKASPPPHLPEEVITHTRAKYLECYERLTGSSFRVE
jgi:phosphoribosylaminoimidazole-succinocarboxamide synthase